MTPTDDAFERLAKREDRLRRKRIDLSDPNAMVSFAYRWFAGLGMAWALLLAVHWIAFSAPRWLVLLHTLAFALTVGYWAFGALYLRAMRRRMPEVFDR